MIAAARERTYPTGRPPIVVSIATIPKRIGAIKLTIDSLLNGTIVPDMIIVTHPEFCIWEGRGYEIPAFLSDPSFCRGIVHHVVADQDWGPGTKLLGGLHVIPEDALIILADDDVTYHPTFVQQLADASMAYPNTSFSHYFDVTRGIRVATGVDGISLWRVWLDDLKEFVAEHVQGTTLMWHDDLWLRFFLLRKRISVRRVLPPDGRQTIYDQVMPNDVLSSQIEGSKARSQMIDAHFERMLKIARVGTFTLSLIRIRAALNRLSLVYRVKNLLCRV